MKFKSLTVIMTIYLFSSFPAHSETNKKQLPPESLTRELPSYKELQAEGWQKTLNSKVIYYFIHTENKEDTSSLQVDLEIALNVWLKLLNLNGIKISPAPDRTAANLILHIGKSAVANHKYLADHPAHTYFVFNWFNQHRNVPMIELNSNYILHNKNYQWISIVDARNKNASAEAKINDVAKRIPLNKIIGQSSNPSEIADSIIQIKNKITYWHLAEIDHKQYFLFYNVLIHEIGHVFGLRDLYDFQTKRMITAQTTVMGNMQNITPYPSAEDIKTVQSLFSWPL